MTRSDLRTWQGSAREALFEENRLKAKRYRLVSPMTDQQLEPGQYMKRPIVGDATSPAGGWALTWCPLPGDA